MNIQQFQYILALAEHRHFETAAEKCFISQSTLSTMIRKFEEEIDLSIFDRKQRPIELTPEGEKLVNRIKIILNEISNLDELVDELKGEVKGTIKIACIPTVAPFLLPLFLIDFAKEHPELHIEVSEVTTDEIIRLLKTRELDIGILSLPINDPDLVESFLYDEPFILYDTTSSSKEVNTINDINMNNFWLMEEGHCMRNQVLDVCSYSKATMNNHLNLSFKASSIGSLIRFVNANKGQTLLPYLATTQFSDEEKKYIKPLMDPLPSRSIGLLTHQYFPKHNLFQLLQKAIQSKVEILL